MGFWAAAIPAIASIAGGLMGSKDAKAANKPQPFSETTTRTPGAGYGSYIDDVLKKAQDVYNRPSPSIMPSGWGRMLSPEQQANQPPPSFGPGAAGGGGGGAAAPANLNWRGRDRDAVQAARTARQQARTERQQNPVAQVAQAAQALVPDDMGGGAAPPPRQLDQGGMFSAPKQIQQDMYQILQQGGTKNAQAGNTYAQNMLAGQVQNPLLNKLFERLWAYQPVPGRPPATTPGAPSDGTGWWLNPSGH